MRTGTALRSVLVVWLLMAAVFSNANEPRRLVVLYSTADEADPGSFFGMIAGIEQIPDVEVMLVALDDEPFRPVSPLLSAVGPRAGAAIRLASAAGNIGPIAVIYPDIGEPYRSVFTKIIEGIEDKAKSKVVSYSVGDNFNAQALSSELKKQDVHVVIALGRSGMKAASLLDKEIGVVVGGVVNASAFEMRGGGILSLAPDPALLFARLKVFSPKTQRVFVVYDPRQNAWLIDLAREAATAQGIELVAREASDLKEALNHYKTILSTINVRNDALWLPQDSISADESTVLPLVLQESWEKGLLFFSSTVSHVRRGALFALYPNNMELGRTLANSALGVATAGSKREITPLRDVLTAFNTRTASHLGLPSSFRQQSFDLVFPEQ